MRKYQIYISTFIIAINLISCAPKNETSQSSSLNDVMGSNQRDVNLGLNGRLQQNSLPADYLKWNAKTKSSEYYHLISDMIQLNLTEQAKQLQKLMPVATDKNQIKFENTPYIETAIGTQKNDAIKKINTYAVQLNQNQKQINTLILGLAQSNLKTNVNSIVNSLDEIKNFLDTLKNALDKSNIMPELRNRLIAEINSQSTNSILPASKIVRDLAQAKTLLDLINSIEKMISVLSLNLDNEQTKLIQVGKNLGAKINSMQNEQSALSLIVDVWNLLTPQERIENILTVNQALYNYLLEQSDVGLRCLQKENCLNPYIAAAKSLKIFPELKKFGIERLRGIIQNSTLQFTLKKLDAQGAEAYQQFPQMLISKIDAGITKQADLLTSVKNDFNGFVKNTAQKWASRNLKNGSVDGFLPSEIQVQLNFVGDQQNQLIPIESGLLSSESLGAEFEVKSKLIHVDQSLAKDYFLDQINKLLSVGGYINSNQVLSQSLVVPVDEPASDYTPFDIKNVGTCTKQFAMPDVLQLTGPLRANLSNYTNDFSVRSQAELLLGISTFIQQLRDWQTTDFDNSIGALGLGEIVPEVVGSEDQTSVFPKSTLFALAIGNASVILNNVLQELSPVFLLGEQSRLIWANEFNFSDQDVMAMAGVVDLKKSQRETIVKSEDVSRYILALAEFMKSTEGIEQTRSDLLIDTNGQSTTGLEKLIDARKKIKLLVIGLSNFLSHQMAASDGGIMSRFSLKERTTTPSNSRRLSDQVLAIKALVASYELNHIIVYKWAALDTYFFMNKFLFSSEKLFYVADQEFKKTLSLPETISTLVAIQKIHDYLPINSQVQNEQIQNNWLTVIQKISIR